MNDNSDGSKIDESDECESPSSNETESPSSNESGLDDQREDRDFQLCHLDLISFEMNSFLR